MATKKQKEFSLDTATTREIYEHLKAEGLNRKEILKLWANEKAKKRRNVMAALQMLFKEVWR